MRLDFYLKVSRLVVRRTQAKKMCDGGKVKVNGRVEKASHDVKIGDILQIDFLNRDLKVKISTIPHVKNVSKKEARELYEIIEEKRKDFFID